MALPRVAFLGPEGTYTHEALLAASSEHEIEPVAAATIVESISMVGEGGAELAFVPFENSIEGSVRATLDTLAFDAPWAAIAGEHDHPIRHSLIAKPGTELSQITAVISHPQANAQCARFIREQLPGAEVQAAASTAEAVRVVAASDEPIAALASKAAADAHGCEVLQEGVEDESENLTRFVWIARRTSGGEDAASTFASRTDVGFGRHDALPTSPQSWKTSLVFAELGADHPGALVEALQVFSDRDVNLTRIESRPLRQGLGRYMFFVDLEGADRDETVAEALGALRDKAESVRVLGSYPVGVAPLG